MGRALVVVVGLALGGLAVAGDTPGPGFLGLTFAQPDRKAVVIDRVIKGYPGEKAGLKAGDVITKLDGREYTDTAEFVLAMRERKAGEEVALTVRRGTTATVYKLKLVPRPDTLPGDP